MRITNLTRIVAVASSTSDATTTTVTTTAAHLMLTGDKVSFPDAIGFYTATVTGASTFTIPNISITSGLTGIYAPAVEVYVNELRAAVSTKSVSFGSASNNASTYQAIGSTTAGAGSCTVSIEVSNNGINWLTFATITLTLGTTATTDGVVLDAPWSYARAKLTAITGTNAKVTVLQGRN
jgi:hypothetical protein